MACTPAAQFWALALSPGSLHFVDTADNFKQVEEAFRRAVVVGLDAEWKPVISSSSRRKGGGGGGGGGGHASSPSPRVSILQVACRLGPSSREVAAPEEALVRIVGEARKSTPAILFLPHLQLWWESAHEQLRAALLMLLADLPPALPLLLLAAADAPPDEIDPEARAIFGRHVYTISPPSCAEREQFFTPAIDAAVAVPRPKARRKRCEKAPLPELPHAPRVEKKASDAELAARADAEEHALRRLRMCLRDVCNRLLYEKRFAMFHYPVDDEDAPDYDKVVRRPMDVASLLQRVDAGLYHARAPFLTDVDLIPHNAKAYNGDDYQGARIVSKACALRDAVHGMLSQMDPALVATCDEIAARGGPISNPLRKDPPAFPQPGLSSARPSPPPAVRASARLRGVHPAVDLSKTPEPTLRRARKSVDAGGLEGIGEKACSSSRKGSPAADAAHEPEENHPADVDASHAGAPDGLPGPGRGAGGGEGNAPAAAAAPPAGAAAAPVTVAGTHGAVATLAEAAAVAATATAATAAATRRGGKEDANLCAKEAGEEPQVAGQGRRRNEGAGRSEAATCDAQPDAGARGAEGAARGEDVEMSARKEKGLSEEGREGEQEAGGAGHGFAAEGADGGHAHARAHALPSPSGTAAGSAGGAGGGARQKEGGEMASAHLSDRDRGPGPAPGPGPGPGRKSPGAVAGAALLQQLQQEEGDGRRKDGRRESAGEEEDAVMAEDGIFGGANGHADGGAAQPDADADADEDAHDRAYRQAPPYGADGAAAAAGAAAAPATACRGSSGAEAEVAQAASEMEWHVDSATLEHYRRSGEKLRYRLVHQTEGMLLCQLESIHASLWRLAYQHRKAADRMPLLEAIESFLEDEANFSTGPQASPL